MTRNLAIPVKEFTSRLSSLLTSGSIARNRLGVAVSGGPDSMALCTLLKKHQQNEGWPETMFAYIVDHGVRPESSEEAKIVAERVFSMGFIHRIIPLSSEMRKSLNRGKPENLETVLRTERIDLLSKAAKNDSVGTVLTAHHQDDQYETVIQRLASGSTFAGLGGIPIKNGIFRRPLLDYPKARLRATCELHDVTWVEDPTNSDPTYALRNAIRQIVRFQDDLPDALRKENIIALAARGSQFRADLCIFRREAFTGMMKVELPQSTYNNPPRVLGHFITALSRIFKSGKVEEFSFRGVGNDRVSTAIIHRFYHSHYFVWNVMNTQFRKFRSTEEEMYTLLLTPENPRAAQRKRTPVLVRVSNQTEMEGLKETSFEFPEEWWQPSRISIYVQKDRSYYLRYFDRKRDLRSPGKLSRYHGHMSKQDRIKFDNALVRASGYLPTCFFAVLCHKEGNHEVIDAFPHFEISLSPDVRVTACGRDGKFNLHQNEREWVDLEGSREI